MKEKKNVDFFEESEKYIKKSRFLISNGPEKSQKFR